MNPLTDLFKIWMASKFILVYVTKRIFMGPSKKNTNLDKPSGFKFYWIICYFCISGFYLLQRVS